MSKKIKNANLYILWQITKNNLSISLFFRVFATFARSLTLLTSQDISTVYTWRRLRGTVARNYRQAWLLLTATAGWYRWREKKRGYCVIYIYNSTRWSLTVITIKRERETGRTVAADKSRRYSRAWIASNSHRGGDGDGVATLGDVTTTSCSYLGSPLTGSQLGCDTPIAIIVSPVSLCLPFDHARQPLKICTKVLIREFACISSRWLIEMQNTHVGPIRAALFFIIEISNSPGTVLWSGRETKLHNPTV